MCNNQDTFLLTVIRVMLWSHCGTCIRAPTAVFVKVLPVLISYSIGDFSEAFYLHYKNKVCTLNASSEPSVYSSSSLCPLISIGWRLHRPATVMRMSSQLFFRAKQVAGRYLSMRKHFIRLMDRSTWILIFPKRRDEAMSFGSSCLPFVKLGSIIFTPRGSNSAMVKPRSARTSSPGCKHCRKPLFFVMKRSLALPPYAGDTNITKKFGAITCSTFDVLCDL